MAKTEKQVISGYHRPICVKCNCELRPEKNGVGVLDLADFGPCELFDADLWKCPKCDLRVVGGFGNGPITSHFEANFQKTIQSYEKSSLIIRNTG